MTRQIVFIPVVPRQSVSYARKPDALPRSCPGAREAGSIATSEYGECPSEDGHTFHSVCVCAHCSTHKQRGISTLAWCPGPWHGLPEVGEAAGMRLSRTPLTATPLQPNRFVLICLYWCLLVASSRDDFLSETSNLETEFIDRSRRGAFSRASVLKLGD